MMFKSAIMFKYVIISLSVLVIGVGLIKVFEKKVEVELEILSDCFPLGNAEIIVDEKLISMTDNEGIARFKLKYDSKQSN